MDRFEFDLMDPSSPLARDVGLARQTMSAELVTREDGRSRGVRSVILQNDLISLDVLVDRGLDIGSARVEQVPLGWQSPTGVVAPWLYESRDSEFLRGFHGGLLTTCGLDHIGPEAIRDAGRFAYEHRAVEHLPMHGRVSAIPATLTGYGVVATDDGMEAYVSGVISQVAVFGEHLKLERRISIRHRSADIRIEDSVTNEGYAPSPLAMMYHVNVGWPLFAPGAQIAVGGSRISGREQPAVSAPEAGSPQSVAIYAIEGLDGVGRAEIRNARLGSQHSGALELSWRAEALPILVRWELTGSAGHYVLGLEPSTMLSVQPDGTQLFPTLLPGETRELGLAISLKRRRHPHAGMAST